MNIVIAAGMIDRKLYSKIRPIIEQEVVEKVYMVRRDSFQGEKIIDKSPKGIFSKIKPLAEVHRIFTIIGLILTKKPDLLIGIGHIPHGIFINTIGKLFGKKVVLLLMGKNDLFLTYPNRKFRKKVLLKIAKWADFIGTRGANSQKWLIEQGVSAEKVFIPQNVFEFGDFKPQQVEKKYDLIYVGLINFYKRVDLLVEVVDKLVDKLGMADIKLAIIGKGKMKDEMIALVKTKGLNNNISFLPVGDKAYLNHVFNESKLFVMTSQGEGLPMVLVEAMSCGLPSVIFDDADISDLAVHEYNALLCKLGDTDTFAEHVKTILTNKELYNRLSANALKIEEEKKEEYSLEYIKDQWKELLSKI